MGTVRQQIQTVTLGGLGTENGGALTGSLLAWQSGSKEDMASLTSKFSAALNRYVCNVIIDKISSKSNTAKIFFFKTLESMLEYLVSLDAHSYLIRNLIT